MDRASEGTRARFNATFREKTAPSSLRPSLASGVHLLEILSVQLPAQFHLSPCWKGRRPSLSIYLSFSPSKIPPQEGGRPASPTHGQSLVCPAPPTIFGFRSGVTGVAVTLRHDRRWRQTGGIKELWDWGHRRKNTVPPSTHMQAHA